MYYILVILVYPFSLIPRPVAEGCSVKPFEMTARQFDMV